MAIALDTSALVDLERSLDREEPPGSLVDEIVVIPAIVWAEALIGVRLADSIQRAARRRAQLEAIRLQTEIEASTPETAEHYADIYSELSQAGALIPQKDIVVAADLPIPRLWCSCRAERRRALQACAGFGCACGFRRKSGPPLITSG